MNSWQGMHLIKEFFAVILVSNGDVLFKLLRSNALNQSNFGFNHSVTNFKGRLVILGNSLTIELCCGIGRIGNFSLRHGRMNTRQRYEKKRRKIKSN